MKEFKLYIIISPENAVGWRMYVSTEYIKMGS